MTCCNFPMTTLYADGTRWQWCAACGKLVELNDDAPATVASGSRQNAELNPPRDTAAEACFPREQNYTE